MDPKDRIIFAADVGSLEELRSYLKVFSGIGAIKLGMELLTHALLTGEPVFQTVMEKSDFRVMWDLKYGDIPATVAGAAREVAKWGQKRILGFTVHCSAGRRAMRETVKAVKDNFGDGDGAPKVIAITLLTSLDQGDLNDLGIHGTPKDVVLRWAKIAAEEKVSAIVCSPHETAEVLQLNPAFIVINPGIRFAGSDLGTQKRVTTPKEAVENGASYIVMGSDLRKGDPVANVNRAIAEIGVAYKSLNRDEVLEVFRGMRSVYEGDHFVYTAGGHGNAYVNKDDIYTDPEQLSILCKEIAFRNRNAGIQVVAGPTVGGVLVANRTAEWLRHFTCNKNIIAVFADQDGDGRVLKRGYPKKVIGKKVLVVEDVLNTGKSAAATVKAIQLAGGEVVACHALCNRSVNKKAAAELVAVPVRALLEVEMDNFSAGECPYCKDGRPIDQELGHGKAFLAEILAQQPEKADWVAKMRKI